MLGFKKCSKIFSKLKRSYTQDDFTGMRIHFLGTSSQRATVDRNVSAVGLQVHGETFIFDSGEGTYKQMILNSNVANPTKGFKIGDIQKIFITHLHGDHIGGIIGVLYGITANERLYKGEQKKIEVYGPLGIRSFLRSQITTKDAIGILKHVKIYEMSAFDRSDIPKDSKGVFRIIDNNEYSIQAKMIRHSTTCFGYVVEEKPKRGRVDMEKVQKLNIPVGPLISELTSGNAIEVDGKVIQPEDVIGESSPGRKIVILGDTFDASNIASIAKKCDVLIHESTFTNEHEEHALYKKHSTSGMAGAFAKKIKAKKLFLTHFSARYTIEDTEKMRLEAIE
eukprot:gene3181-5497_t